MVGYMVGYYLDDLQTLFLLFIKKKKKLDSMFFTGVFVNKMFVIAYVSSIRHLSSADQNIKPLWM